MSFNVYKDLKRSIDCADVDDNYKRTLLKGVEHSLKQISGMFREDVAITLDEYYRLLEVVRTDIRTAREGLYHRDTWVFDYVSHERFIIGELKKVMWARMEYEDVKKVRSPARQEVKD